MTLLCDPHLASSQAGNSKFLFPVADSWGAATKQSPLKINELNDGLRSISDGGVRGRGTGLAAERRGDSS